MYSTYGWKSNKREKTKTKISLFNKLDHSFLLVEGGWGEEGELGLVGFGGLSLVHQSVSHGQSINQTKTFDFCFIHNV